MENVQICTFGSNVIILLQFVISTRWVAKSPLTAILVTRQIWGYCIDHNIWLSASHLPGCENTEADRESRHFNDRTEWKLEPTIYNSITEKFGQPSIDLFASRLNKQCSGYVSWRPDPDALFVDAFSANLE